MLSVSSVNNNCQPSIQFQFINLWLGSKRANVNFYQFWDINGTDEALNGLQHTKKANVCGQNYVNNKIKMK